MSRQFLDLLFIDRSEVRIPETALIVFKSGLVAKQPFLSEYLTANSAKITTATLANLVTSLDTQLDQPAKDNICDSVVKTIFQ